jgi:hypothetical protein
MAYDFTDPNFDWDKWTQEQFGSGSDFAQQFTIPAIDFTNIPLPSLETPEYQKQIEEQVAKDFETNSKFGYSEFGAPSGIGNIFGVVLAVASLAVPGIGQVVGSSILSAVGITGASAAVTAGVGAAALSAASTAAAGGSVEDVLKNAASAGFASGINLSLGGGVTGAAAGSVAGTAIRGGDADQVLTNALAAGVGAGVQGVIGPAAGTIARDLIVTGGVSDQTLLNAAAAEIGGFNKPGNASAQIVEATGTPTLSSEINTQMQRLNFQQDLRDQLMNDGAFQQVSVLPVVAAGAQIAAEVGIPAIIRAAPVIAEYMGANMAREQIAAAIADVAGHAAALWYLNNLNNDSYFGKRFIPETGQTVTVNLPPISEAEQSRLDKLYDQYQTTYAYIPTNDPNKLDTVVITTKLSPEQQTALSNPATAEAAAANVSATVTTVKPNGQTTTQLADTTSGVISVNNTVPVNSEASGAAGSVGGGGGGGAAGGGAAGGNGGGGTPAAGTPGAGPAGGETAGAAVGETAGGGAGGVGGGAAGGAGTVTGAGVGGGTSLVLTNVGPGAGPGAGPATGPGAAAGPGTDITDPFAGYVRPTAPDTSGGGGTLPGVAPTPMGVPDLGGPPSGGGSSTIVGAGGNDGVDPFAGYVRPTAPDTSGGGKLPEGWTTPTPMEVPILPGPPSANVTANVTSEDVYVRPTAPKYTLPVLPDWTTPIPMGVPDLGGPPTSNVVVTGSVANNVANVAYPTITRVPPPPPPKRAPIITGASPARLLADALAAYRPAGAIEGEESGKERQNVWNEKSLRLKDALGL